MESGIFDCPEMWERLLPEDTRRLRNPAELPDKSWDLLALTRSGCQRLGQQEIRCRTLLVPGDCPPALLARLHAETVISYGLSPRDSLTLSSLTEPVLCVQRTLLRPDGAPVEPQEFPLPELPGPAVELLPVFGLRLLQMPLTAAQRLW